MPSFHSFKYRKFLYLIRNPWIRSVIREFRSYLTRNARSYGYSHFFFSYLGLFVAYSAFSKPNSWHWLVLEELEVYHQGKICRFSFSLYLYLYQCWSFSSVIRKTMLTFFFMAQLSLSSCKIQTLGSSLIFLTNLKELRLADNEITVCMLLL